MEADPLRFTLNGIYYRIDPHIWTAYPDRVGLITVERIVEAIRQPDFQEIESEYVTYFWKWFSRNRNRWKLRESHSECSSGDSIGIDRTS